MKIQLASHYGMCFGVRDALSRAHDAATSGPVTILGELVHNPLVQKKLSALGVHQGRLDEPTSSSTIEVLITAHGAADRDREQWRNLGHTITDTTCPLVTRAHEALARLVADGCLGVVIGQANHVEVRGLTGDFPDAIVALTDREIDAIPFAPRIGVISQTTQPVSLVKDRVARLRSRFPSAEIIYRDTVCQPTKDRQTALDHLCANNEVILVVGGHHSNNTRQLVLTAERMGRRTFQVESAAEIKPAWLAGVETVGVTAGTSTLEETVMEVVARLRELNRPLCPASAEAAA